VARGVELTDSGKVFLPEAQAIFAQAERAKKSDAPIAPIALAIRPDEQSCDRKKFCQLSRYETG
jgi:DNA-binding transcriptional LysR family regulator